MQSAKKEKQVQARRQENLEATDAAERHTQPRRRQLPKHQQLDSICEAAVGIPLGNDRQVTLVKKDAELRTAFEPHADEIEMANLGPGSKWDADKLVRRLLMPAAVVSQFTSLPHSCFFSSPFPPAAARPTAQEEVFGVDIGANEFRALALKQRGELVAFATIGRAKNAPTGKAMVELLCLARRGERGGANRETGRRLLLALMADGRRQARNAHTAVQHPTAVLNWNVPQPRIGCHRPSAQGSGAWGADDDCAPQRARLVVLLLRCLAIDRHGRCLHAQ